MNPTTLFQLLIQRRKWTKYEVFLDRYQATAQQLADTEGPPGLATATIEKRQFLRWAHGEMKGLPRNEARRILEAMFCPSSVQALFAPAPSTPPPTPIGSGSREWEPQTHDRSGELSEDVVMAAASESADFAAWAESSNCGPNTMEQLEADIRRIVTTYPNRPVWPVFHEVRALRDRAFELLEGRQPPGMTKDLYVAAGVLCGVLANASFDLGKFAAAETQARTAFMCGELARHNGLRVWVRGLQALIAYWDGRPADAVRLAEGGAQFVPEQGTSLIRLHSIKARAYGQLNQPDDALASLREAERLRDQLTAADDLPGGMMAFPIEKQMFYSSTTHLWLGGSEHLSDAEAAADEAVTRFEAAPPGQRRLGEMALARMDLAVARLGRGDLDGAAPQVHAVLQVSARRGTDSIRKRLEHFTRVLERHPSSTSPLAISLQEAVTAHQERQRLELPAGGM
ncbi:MULTISPECIES: tetratricopeptide repeat protein [Streptomyces]|uniref:tetratricopeptide repeat protein n=1 Tax=Streptomyces TaxID=1883 RepID=UPI0004CDB2A8|nr:MULTISPECIES: hypothetical protein [Streptomyces]KOT52699.1 hypothetical protein ADK43_30010 [Streptomyces rimosus subsp. rimosus]